MKQGWEIKKLGEVCEIINGFAFKSQLFKKIGDDILRISNIQNGTIDDKDIVHFSKEDYPRINFDKYAVYPNDIVVALSGATTGKFGINNTGRKLYLNQRVAICREKVSFLHHLFLFYFLKTQSKTFLESAAGVAQPNLSTEQMKEYDIPIPPLAEQERIVAELDCLSGVIEKKKQQLKELDALAQSIFYEMFGDPITSKFQKYQLSQLSEYKLTYGSGASAVEYDGIIRYVRITDIQEDGKLGESIVSPSIYEDKYLLNDGDILFARSGATVGKTYHYKSNNGRAIYAGYLIRFIPNKSIVLPEYIFYYTRSEFYKSFIKQSAQTVAQPNINAKQYGELIVPLPPLSLQQSFASKIEAIEKQKELIKKSIKEVETLFNSRMDYYFN